MNQQGGPSQQSWASFGAGTPGQTAQFPGSHFPQAPAYAGQSAVQAPPVANAGGGGGWVDFGDAQQVIPTTTYVSAKVTSGSYEVQHTGHVAPATYNVQYTGHVAPAHQPPAAPPAWGGSQQWAQAQAAASNPMLHAQAYGMQAPGQQAQFGMQPAGYMPQYGMQYTGQVPQYGIGYGMHQAPPTAGPTGYSGQPVANSYAAPATAYGAVPPASSQAWPGQPGGFGIPSPLTPIVSTVSPQVAEATLAAAGAGHAFAGIGHAFQLPSAPATWAQAPAPTPQQPSYTASPQASYQPAPQPTAYPAPAASQTGFSTAAGTGWMSFEDDAPAPPATASVPIPAIPSAGHSALQSSPGFGVLTTTAAAPFAAPTPTPPTQTAAGFQWQSPAVPAPAPAPDPILRSRDRPLDSTLFSDPPEPPPQPPNAAAPMDAAHAHPPAWAMPPAAAQEPIPHALQMPAHVPSTSGPSAFAAAVPQQQLPGSFSNPFPPTAIQEHASAVGYTETPLRGNSPMPLIAGTRPGEWTSFDESDSTSAFYMPPPGQPPVVPPSPYQPQVAASAAAPPTLEAAFDMGESVPSQVVHEMPEASPLPGTSSDVGLHGMGSAPVQPPAPVINQAEPAPVPAPGAAPVHPPPTYAVPTPASALPSHAAALPEDMFSSIPQAPAPASESERALQNLHVTMVAINTARSSGLSMQQSLALASASSVTSPLSSANAFGGLSGHGSYVQPAQLSLGAPAQASPLSRPGPGPGLLPQALSGHLSGPAGGPASQTGSGVIAAGYGSGRQALPEDLFGMPSGDSPKQALVQAPPLPAPPLPAPPAPSGWATFGDDDSQNAFAAAAAATPAVAVPAAATSAPGLGMGLPEAANAYDTDSGSGGAGSPLATAGASSAFSQLLTPALAAAIAAAAAAESKSSSVTAPPASAAAAVDTAVPTAADDVPEAHAPVVETAPASQPQLPVDTSDHVAAAGEPQQGFAEAIPDADRTVAATSTSPGQGDTTGATAPAVSTNAHVSPLSESAAAIPEAENAALQPSAAAEVAQVPAATSDSLQPAAAGALAASADTFSSPSSAADPLPQWTTDFSQSDDAATAWPGVAGDSDAVQTVEAPQPAGAAPTPAGWATDFEAPNPANMLQPASAAWATEFQAPNLANMPQPAPAGWAPELQVSNAAAVPQPAPAGWAADFEAPNSAHVPQPVPAGWATDFMASEPEEVPQPAAPAVTDPPAYPAATAWVGGFADEEPAFGVPAPQPKVATAVANPTAGASGVKFPPTFNAWVERCFDRCHSDAERHEMTDRLTKRIRSAEQGGNAGLVDWDKDPIPDITAIPPSPGSVQQPIAGASGAKFPPTFDAWVERCFHRCHSDVERHAMTGRLTRRIRSAEQGGNVWLVDWDKEPIPDITAIPPSPGSVQQPTEAQQPPEVPQPAEDGFPTANSASAAAAPETAVEPCSTTTGTSAPATVDPPTGMAAAGEAAAVHAVAEPQSPVNSLPVTETALGFVPALARPFGREPSHTSSVTASDPSNGSLTSTMPSMTGLTMSPRAYQAMQGAMAQEPMRMPVLVEVPTPTSPPPVAGGPLRVLSGSRVPSPGLGAASAFRTSPTSLNTSGGGTPPGCEVPVGRRASWRNQEQRLPSGEPDALELSIAAAEALHVAKQVAAASVTDLFGPPTSLNRASEDSEEAAVVVPAGTGLQQASNLRTAYSVHTVGQQQVVAISAAVATAVPLAGSRSVRNSFSSMSHRPPSPPLHTWQRDSFSHPGKRSSLELGIAAAEAAALAARASSRSSLDIQLGSSGQWAGQGTGMDGLFAGSNEGSGAGGGVPLGMSRSSGRQSANGLAQVREDSVLAGAGSDSLTMRTAPADMGVQLSQGVVLGSSLFGSAAPSVNIVHGFTEPSPRGVQSWAGTGAGTGLWGAASGGGADPSATLALAAADLGRSFSPRTTQDDAPAPQQHVEPVHAVDGGAEGVAGLEQQPVATWTSFGGAAQVSEAYGGADVQGVPDEHAPPGDAATAALTTDATPGTGVWYRPGAAATQGTFDEPPAFGLDRVGSSGLARSGALPDDNPESWVLVDKDTDAPPIPVGWAESQAAGGTSPGGTHAQAAGTHAAGAEEAPQWGVDPVTVTQLVAAPTSTHETELHGADQGRDAGHWEAVEPMMSSTAPKASTTPAGAPTDAWTASAAVAVAAAAAAEQATELHQPSHALSAQVQSLAVALDPAANGSTAATSGPDAPVTLAGWTAFDDEGDDLMAPAVTFPAGPAPAAAPWAVGGMAAPADGSMPQPGAFGFEDNAFGDAGCTWPSFPDQPAAMSFPEANFGQPLTAGLHSATAPQAPLPASSEQGTGTASEVAGAGATGAATLGAIAMTAAATASGSAYNSDGTADSTDHGLSGQAAAAGDMDTKPKPTLRRPPPRPGAAPASGSPATQSPTLGTGLGATTFAHPPVDVLNASPDPPPSPAQPLHEAVTGAAAPLQPKRAAPPPPFLRKAPLPPPVQPGLASLRGLTSPTTASPVKPLQPPYEMVTGQSPDRPLPLHPIQSPGAQVPRAPPSAHDSVVAQQQEQQAVLPPPPSYDSVMAQQHGQQAALPPPPSYDSVMAQQHGQQAALPPPPSYDLVVAPKHEQPTALAPPPSYDSVVAQQHGDQAVLPPPSYDLVMGQQQGQQEALPPPPSYDSVVAQSSQGSVEAAAPPPPAYDTLFGPAAQAAPAPAAQPAGFNSMFNFAMTNPAAVQTTPVDLSEGMAEQESSPYESPEESGALMAEPLAAPMHDTGCRGAPQFRDVPSSHEEQLCVEVRLPPLHPKKALLPKRLEAGFGSLFAMPGPPSKAMLQWEAADSELVVPPGLQRATEEDADSAPCGYVPSPDNTQEPISAVLMDELSGTMWAGHEDGRVSRWSVAAGRGARCEQTFKAHTQNKIRCLAVTPWGDLWTGSASGMLRVWSHPCGTLGTRPPSQYFEAKRTGGYRAHGKVLALVASPTGRTVWSAGSTSLIIWDAYTREPEGALRIGGGPLPHAGEEVMVWIDPARGIDPSKVGPERFKHRYEARYRQRFAMQGGAAPPAATEDSSSAGVGDEADPESEATTFQQVAKGVSIMGKFAAKLGKKMHKTAAAVSKNVQDMNRQAVESVPLQSETAQGVNEKRTKVKALLASPEHGMIVIYKSGQIDCYTEYGKLQWSQEARAPLTCGMLLVGQLWVGASDGCIRIYDLARGAPLFGWPAHLASLKSMVTIKGIVYSLARDGSIRAWPPMQPPPPQALQAWKDTVRQGLRAHKLGVLAGTWNVNTSKAALQSVFMWLGKRVAKADIVCVGLQEVEMGGHRVALDAFASVVNKAALETGTAMGRWWSDAILHAIGGGETFTRVGLRQMTGVLVLVYVRKELIPFVGEVVTDNVACGVYGVGGNKGATAVSLTLYRRRLVFLSSHFAAHQENVAVRNADYTKIVKGLRFQDMGVRGLSKNTTSPGQSATSQQPAPPRNTSLPGTATPTQQSVLSDEDDEEGVSIGVSRIPSTTSLPVPPASVLAKDTVGLGLLCAETVIWMGDFNYRVGAPYEFVVDKVAAGSLSELAVLDQARQEMARGVIFHGMAEGALSFPPTYKFDKGLPSGTYADGSPMPRYQGHAMPYDSSEKKRIPAWTDRIFFRGSLLPQGATAPREEDLQLTLTDAPTAEPAYGTVLQVCDSDHKPVYALLDLLLPAFNQEHKRRCSMQVLTALLSGIIMPEPPPIVVELSPGQQQQQEEGAAIQVMNLRGNHKDGFRLWNTGDGIVSYTFGGDGSPAWRLPAWLDIQPVSGVLQPHANMIVEMRAAGPPEEPLGMGPPPAAEKVSNKPAQMVVLRVYAQHIVSTGSGALNALTANSRPLLLKVQHTQ